MIQANPFKVCANISAKDKAKGILGVKTGAKDFGYDFFDNPSKDLAYAYKGYYDNGFYKPSIPVLVDLFSLTSESKILDVGCAKGFLLAEFVRAGYKNVYGIDISQYALSACAENVRGRVVCGDLEDPLPYQDNFFDLVICKDSLPYCATSRIVDIIKDIQRVSTNHTFIQPHSISEDYAEIIKKGDPCLKTAKPYRWWESILSEAEYTGHYMIRRGLE